MSQLEDLITKYCPDGVDFIELQKLFNTRNGYTPSRRKPEYWENGTVPWFRMDDIRANGNVLSKSTEYIADSAVKKGRLFPADTLIVATSATIGVHALIEIPFLCNQRFTALIINKEYKDLFRIKFLFYYCYVLDEWCLRNTTQSSFAAVDMKRFQDFKFPVPPLEVQDEIVRILDSFTQLEAELEAELEARRKQYEYYKDKLLSFSDDIPLLPLSDIADIGTGSSNTNEAIDAGKYPFFVRSQEPLRKNDYDFDETAIITAGDGVGVGKVYHYVDGKYALHQRAYRIHINTPSVCPKFFFHYMKSAFLPYIEKTMYHGSVPSIRRPMLNRFPVPVPPLAEQERIVAILDKFDALVNDLFSGLPAEIAARRKQYEYYRDRLLTFTPAK